SCLHDGLSFRTVSSVFASIICVTPSLCLLCGHEQAYEPQKFLHLLLSPSTLQRDHHASPHRQPPRSMRSCSRRVASYAQRRRSLCPASRAASDGRWSPSITSSTYHLTISYIQDSTVSSSGMSSLTRSASMSRTSRSQMYPPARHRSARAFCGFHAPHRASTSSYETGRTRLGVGRMISCPYWAGVVVAIVISPPPPIWRCECCRTQRRFRERQRYAGRSPFHAPRHRRSTAPPTCRVLRKQL